MITQCSIRHLYTAQDKKESNISLAKSFERRRCNHHTLDEPLSTLKCLSEVVDPKDSRVNKFNYIVASQDDNVRAKMREIPGVPLIYIKRSIMILEPMAGASTDRRAREERSKMKEGITKMGARGTKRSRDDDDEDAAAGVKTGTAQEPDSKRKKKGPKGPNPLSMRKPKARDPEGTHQPQVAPMSEKTLRARAQDAESEEQPAENATEDEPKKKRRRKHKSKTEAAGVEPSIAAAGDISDG